MAKEIKFKLEFEDMIPLFILQKRRKYIHKKTA